MNSNQRACIAGVAAAIINNKKISNVYSYEISKYITISGDVNEKGVRIFDYSRSCYIQGNGDGNGKYNLFDYGVSRHIKLNIKKDKFDGFDYTSNRHFSGSIRGNNVSLYDYETSMYYNFSC